MFGRQHVLALAWFTSFTSWPLLGARVQDAKDASTAWNAMRHATTMNS